MEFGKRIKWGIIIGCIGFFSTASAQLLKSDYNDTLNCGLDSNRFKSLETAKSHYWQPVESWMQDSNFLKYPVPKYQFIKYKDYSNQFAVAEDSGNIFLFLPKKPGTTTTLTT